MQGSNLFNNGLLQPKRPPIGQEQQKMIRCHQLRLVFGLIRVLLYPLAILGSIPLLTGLAIDKRDKATNAFDVDYEGSLKWNSIIFLNFSAVLFAMNAFVFIPWIPRGYLSAYFLFPLNLLHTALCFNWETIVALLIESSRMEAILLAPSSPVAKRKMISREDGRRKITKSEACKDREENKSEESQRPTGEQEEAYEEAVKTVDTDKYRELPNQLLFGTGEFGLPYIINFPGFNQHVLVPATTGSGKTTLLQLLVQHAVKLNFPVILIGGKGAWDTLESIWEITEFYNKKMHASTGDGDMRYNPVKHGNGISTRDKLVFLTETENVFYSGVAKVLLQVAIQLLDEFKEAKIILSGDVRTTEAVEQSLPFVQWLLPLRNALYLFADVILPNNPELFEIEVEKKIQKPKEKSVKEGSGILPDSDLGREEKEGDSQIKNSKFRNVSQLGTARKETEMTVLNPETLDLDPYYLLLKRNLRYLLTDKEAGENTKQKLLEWLFVRYEHRDSPFYLYVTSETLQTNINMLLDSELGKLFDTKDAESVLDMQEIVNQRKLVYISFGGLIYKEYICILAQMLVGDVNYFTSEMYRKNVKREALVIFDEPASYLNGTFTDVVNKGKGAGVYGIFAPQTMADITKLSDKLMEQPIGSVNTLLTGKIDGKGEAGYWDETMGTCQDIDVTSITEQENGYSDVGKSDRLGDRGIKRNVDRFKINSSEVKELRIGGFVIYRTVENVNLPPQKVYVWSALEWLQKSKSK